MNSEDSVRQSSQKLGSQKLGSDKPRCSGRKGERLAVQTLSECDERLLMRFHDGELGRVRRWRVQRMLERRLSAYEFLEDLKCCGNLSQQVPKQVDFWNAVDARLNALHTGAPKLVEPKESLLQGLFASLRVDPEKLSWAFAGSACGAAAAIAVLMLNVNLQGTASVVATRSNAIAGAPQVVAQNVSLETSGPKNARRVPVPIERFEPSVMEVDWMRSAGRVKVMRDPNGDSPIIWVKPREPVGASVGFQSRPRGGRRPMQSLQGIE